MEEVSCCYMHSREGIVKNIVLIAAALVVGGGGLGGKSHCLKADSCYFLGVEG